MNASQEAEASSIEHPSHQEIDKHNISTDGLREEERY